MEASRWRSRGTASTSRTAELVTGELLDGVSLLDLGEHRLKDLSAPQRLYQVGSTDFPPLKTLSPRTSLPIAGSPLIGRGRELAELTGLVRGGARLVTVTGTGGAGKTRLALQAAAELAGAFPDGVFWVPLAALTDASLVLPTIAQALGIPDRLEHGLADRKTLLVLDNFEHLLDAAAAVSRLLAGAPDARALVTSRSPLQIDGEHEFALDALADGEAISLFIERSRAAGRRLTADAPVLEICRRLDNLPLAIELAAARSKLLAPEALLTRLDEHRLPLLTAGRRDAPERQRTLRATIDWSYGLLDEPTQALFPRLTVFAGDFSLEAAEAVCDADLDALQALVDLSLLKPIGDGRFLMLETIREYAAERLAAVPDDRDVRRRHTEWFSALSYAQALPARESKQEALELLARDEQNFRAAIANAVELELTEAAYRLLVGLWFFFIIRGHTEELERWARLVLGLPPGGDVELRAGALVGASEVLRTRGDFPGARRYKQEALPLLREAGMEALAAGTLTDLASMTAAEGSLGEAEGLAREALGIRERLGNEVGIAHARSALAEIAFWRGDYRQALELYEADGPAYRNLDMLADEADSHRRMGACLRRLGTLDVAATRLQEALELASAVDDVTTVVETLRELAAVALGLGNERAAAVLLGGVERMFEESGQHVDDPADYESIVAGVRERLDPEELQLQWAHGARLERADLFEAALESVRKV